MNLAILSRSERLYSTESIVRAAERKGHTVEVLDHMHCDIFIDNSDPKVYYYGECIDDLHAIVPRIGTSATSYGASVVRQFMNMGVFSTLKPNALLDARDKMSCLQHLAVNGICVPKSIFSNDFVNLNEMIDHLGGLPAVIKMIRGTHGQGVILAQNRSNTASIIEAFKRSNSQVLMQEFIKEAKGADIRIFVVDQEVVGVMKRQAAPGEFRSNLHRGATASEFKLTNEQGEIALKAAKILGLDIAGVDMLLSKDGPMILEVNASPGLEGIETTTGNDIAGKIIEFVERNISD